MATDYLKFYDYPADVTAWVEIEGAVYPILGVTAEYAVNAIPVATCQLAVGKLISKPPSNYTGPAVPSVVDVRTTLETVRYNKKAVVWMIMKGEYANGINWPDTKFPIFCGYTNGLGFTRSFSEVGLTLSIVHWLIDLDRTAAASELLAAGDSHNILCPYNIGISNGGSEVRASSGRALQDPDNNNKKEFTVLSAAETRQINVNGDMWQSLVKQVFGIVANLGPLGAARLRGNISTADIPIAGNTPTGEIFRNSVALDALFNGIPFPGVGSVCFDLSDEIKTAVALLHTGENPIVKEYILNYVGAQLEPINSSSLWNTLVNVASSMRLAVIPGVKTATVVPHLNRCLPFRVSSAAKQFSITADEYAMSNLQPIALDRVISGVVLYGGSVSPTGLENNSGLLMGAAGIYPTTEEAAARSADDRFGHWHMVQAPQWLDMYAVVATTHVPGAGSTDNTPSAVPTAQSPGSAEKPPETHRRKIVQDLLRPISSKWAKSVYFETKYEARRGFLTGKLRFDICPGSQVRIQLASTNPEVPSDAWVQGCVEQVTIVIDAQNNNASTGFVIKNYRTKNEEISSTEVSPSVHPLYSGELWTGSCLIKIPNVSDI